MGHPCATPQQELAGFLCLLPTFSGLTQRAHPAKGTVVSPIFGTRGKHKKLQNLPPFTPRAWLIWIKHIKPNGADGHQHTTQHSTPGSDLAHQNPLGTGRDGPSDSTRHEVTSMCTGTWALPCVQIEESLPLQTGRRRRRRMALRKGRALTPEQESWPLRQICCTHSWVEDVFSPQQGSG